jgi:hypothetical protein
MCQPGRQHAIVRHQLLVFHPIVPLRTLAIVHAFFSPLNLLIMKMCCC